MGIESWSTTAASNNSASPNGAPEGMAPSGVNDTIRQNMASVRAFYENPQYINLGYTHTYASGTSFTIATTDYTSTYHAGRRIRAVGSSTGTIYGTITSSSYSSSTTVNVSWDSGSLSNEALTISISALTKTNDAIPYLYKKSADVASATTIDLNAIRGDLVDVTGTTTITTVTLAEGQERVVRFTGALTFTHGASLVLPGSANITTAAGDFAILRGYASSVVRCVGYFPISGKPIISSTTGTDLALTGKLSNTAAGTLTIATGAITVTGSNHLVDTESAAATDDLDTISGGVDGMQLTLQIVNAARVITFTQAGNILFPSGESMVVNSINTKLRFIYRSSDSKWLFQGTNRLYAPATQTITFGGQLVLAHGLAKAPDFVTFKLVNVNTEGGYTTGQKLLQNAGFSDGGSSARGISAIIDATNITIRFGSSGISIIKASDGTTQDITAANWTLDVRAMLLT